MHYQLPSSESSSKRISPFFDITSRSGSAGMSDIDVQHMSTRPTLIVSADGAVYFFKLFMILILFLILKICKNYFTIYFLPFTM